MSNQLRVKGHTLAQEGRVFRDYCFVTDGPAKCSCGWKSEKLTSDGQRQRAHRAHKMDVLVEMGKRMSKEAGCDGS